MMIDSGLLKKQLKDARYKVLVACRPLASARTAHNLACQAVIGALIGSNAQGPELDAEVQEVKGLMLEE